MVKEQKTDTFTWQNSLVKKSNNTYLKDQDMLIHKITYS